MPCEDGHMETVDEGDQKSKRRQEERKNGRKLKREIAGSYMQKRVRPFLFFSLNVL